MSSSGVRRSGIVSSLCPTPLVNGRLADLPTLCEGDESAVQNSVRIRTRVSGQSTKKGSELSGGRRVMHLTACPRMCSPELIGSGAQRTSNGRKAEERRFPRCSGACAPSGGMGAHTAASSPRPRLELCDKHSVKGRSIARRRGAAWVLHLLLPCLGFGSDS